MYANKLDPCLLMSHVEKPIFPIGICSTVPSKADILPALSAEAAENCSGMRGN